MVWMRRCAVSTPPLLVAHDLAVVHHMADRTAVMYLPLLIETAPKRLLLGNPHHPDLRALLSEIPLPDRRRRGCVTLLGGDVPSPMTSPPGPYAAAKALREPA